MASLLELFLKLGSLAQAVFALQQSKIYQYYYRYK